METMSSQQLRLWCSAVTTEVRKRHSSKVVGLIPGLARFCVKCVLPASAGVIYAFLSQYKNMQDELEIQHWL